MSGSAADYSEEASDETQRIIYAISHDLQAPARHIRSFLEILEAHLSERLDDEARGFMERIDQAATTLQSKLNDLTDLSRVSTNGIEIVPCDVRDVVDEVLEGIRPTLVRGDGTITVDRLPVVLADRKQLVQVFAELIDNALKFCARPVAITISCEDLGDHISIGVADSGPGFAATTPDEAFELFRRFHHSDVPGTGAGLTIVRRILDRHDGSVAIESSREAGTTVRVAMPVAAVASRGRA